ncbi:potassium transporter TrkA [Nocardioides anomalus]|uniref:Potassium transporter TrkA n=1 Tax=Nocardioides anomalus TaxID=2712223 RepID=A0A6G6WFQ0_9ACTN|nr:potassium transporter TrkA [Nocardioides anomalus]QIG43987.1 potassium transporter TrkA [Nocardioides anomalus]
MARTGQQLRVRTAKAMSERGGSTVKVATEKRSGLGDRLRYMFDNSMSAGTPALVAWLFAATLLLIVVFAFILTVTGVHQEGEDRGFFSDLFYNLLHALDPGTVGGDTGTWGWKLTMLALTLGGLFIVSALIGVLASGIDTKLADLRRGRSIVLEEDHTVILGWSESIFTIISELTLANESRKDPVIVILADRDKVDMEDELKVKVPERRGTRIICRSGSPMDLDDLRLSSHDTARSVILLAPESDDPDSEVIKTLLALTHDGEDGPRIVAEIQEPSNLEAAALVGKHRTTLLDIRETVAKLVVQTSRQSGAAAVYTELFDYSGDEFYFFEDHGLAGSTYGEAQLAFEAASVVGILDGTTSKLNPPPETVITAEQTLIVVVEDDSALAGQSRSMTEPALTRLGEQTETEVRPTQALVIGWNDRAPIVVRELDRYAPPGSSVTVLTTYGEPELPAFQNIAVSVVKASTTSRAVLEEHVGADLDQIVVLCYDRDLDTQTADSRTLVSLLHVRDILRRVGSETPVVSEMLDDRNRVLASVADVDDIVVSGEIVSLVVTQLSEDGRLEAVFKELLGAEGSEIYLRPAEWYVQPGDDVSWATVVAGAARRGETALGLKSALLADPGMRFGVVVNPPKSQTYTIGADDAVVVLAED